MKATELLRKRVIFAENKFAELVLWQLQRPLAGSRHSYKYRLAYIVDEICVLRYDNEAGKGDHQHDGSSQHAYTFSSPDKLLEDFQETL